MANQQGCRKNYIFFGAGDGVAIFDVFDIFDIFDILLILDFDAILGAILDVVAILDLAAIFGFVELIFDLDVILVFGAIFEAGDGDGDCAKATALTETATRDAITTDAADLNCIEDSSRGRTPRE